MLRYVQTALHHFFGDAVWAVVGYGEDQVRQTFADQSLHFIEQNEQLGTGHALLTALPILRAAGMQQVLLVNGDTPLISTDILSKFIEKSAGSSLSVATLELPDPSAYGRIIRNEQGNIAAIVEAKDYDPAKYGADPHEINAGVYLVDLVLAEKLLPFLTKSNASGEYYLTDLVRLAVNEGMSVSAVSFGNDPRLLGINTPVELAHSEETLRQALVQFLLESGVVVHSPESVRIGPFVQIDSGAEISGPCEMFGHCHIESGAVIEAFCSLRDTDVHSGAVVHSFSHMDGAIVGENCIAGPYARLRPGSVMAKGSHIGNFVEMKKTTLGEGSKANHLTYLGDSEIGAGVNVGAGTITCNYDGVNKYRTTIGTGSFIGSNTSLVAPVNVGAHTVIGAGSVITKDVPDSALGVTRAKQKNILRKKES